MPHSSNDQEQYIELQEDLIAIAETIKKVSENRQKIVVSECSGRLPLWPRRAHVRGLFADVAVRARGAEGDVGAQVHPRQDRAPNQGNYCRPADLPQAPALDADLGELLVASSDCFAAAAEGQGPRLQEVQRHEDKDRR